MRLLPIAFWADAEDVPPDPPIIVMEDQFTTDRATGAVDGTAAEPGTDTRTITDTEDALYIEDGYLRVWNNGSIGISDDLGWGAAVLSYGSVTRLQGRTFCAIIDVEDLDSTFAIYLGTDPDDPDGHGWIVEAGALAAISNSIVSVLAASTTGNIRPMTYLCCIVMQAAGAYILLSTFAADPGLSGNMADPVGIPAYPNARLVWAEQSGTTTPLYPTLNVKKIYNYPGGHAISDAWVADLVSAGWTVQNGVALAHDTFVRADNISSLGGSWTVDGGTWGINGNAAYQPGNTGFARAWLPGDADGVVEADITIGTDKNIGLMVRRVDADNFVRVWLNGGNTIYIQTWVAGAYDDGVVATAVTFNVGTTYRLRVAFQDAWYKVWVDGLVLIDWSADANARHLTGTGHGLYAANDNGTSRWNSFAVWPHVVTLPAELQASAAANDMRGWTAGDTLASDTFTDTDATALASHTPTLGGAWTEHYGDWEIDGNKLIVSGTGDSGGGQFATQAIAQVDAECSISITQPTPLGDYVFAGIIGYVDSSNYVIIRLADGVVLQPNDHEIEIGTVVGGSSAIVHKVQFGAAYPAGSTHTLKVQFKGDRLRIFFDDDPRESYVLPTALVARTRFGVYHNVDSSAQIYDSWVVKAL